MKFDFIEITDTSELDVYINEILSLQEACDMSLPEKSWYIPSDKEEFYDYIERENGIIILALCGDRIAGVISSGKDDNHYEQAKAGGAKLPSKSSLYISLVCVNQQFRGNGLQYQLMMRTIEIAKRKRYKCCWCRVHPDNIYSVRNIEKAGMAHTSDYTTDIGWPRKIYTRRLSWL